ncbi:MAG TPA: iron-containing redox enzyme family protein [Nitrospiria bacterium]|nr:iron-containing redox enzyme family protein [Nitrospiria bacterium]
MDRGSPEAFKESLLQIMDRKHHWAWDYFSGNRINKDQLKIHYQQEWAVYVRDFPVFLSRVHSKNPPISVRQALAANLFEEETGGLSIGRSHPDLFLYMMEGLGFARGDFESVRLLPKARRYRAWLDEVTTNGSWLEGAAAVTVFVEGSVKDRKEIEETPTSDTSEIEVKVQNHPLVRFHGVDPKHLDLIRAHQTVERGHRIDAWRMVLDHAVTAGEQRKVKKTLTEALDLWLTYRDGVSAACGLKREGK